MVEVEELFCILRPAVTLSPFLHMVTDIAVWYKAGVAIYKISNTEYIFAWRYIDNTTAVDLEPKE